MALDIQTIIDLVEGHALSTGYFDEVNAHEPDNAPGNSVAGAIWLQKIEPCTQTSSLNSTSIKLVLNVRIYVPWTHPYDNVDVELVKALDALMAAYVGDFTLGGNIRNVDVRGIEGDKLSALAGYLTQDSTDFRVMTITLPLLVNDIWDEEE